MHDIGCYLIGSGHTYNNSSSLFAKTDEVSA